MTIEKRGGDRRLAEQCAAFRDAFYSCDRSAVKRGCDAVFFGRADEASGLKIGMGDAVAKPSP